MSSLVVGPAAPRRVPWRGVVRFLPVVLVLALLGVRFFVAEVVRARGNAMAPAVLDGDIVVVMHLRTPQLGDVVLVDPGDDGPPVLRRVVGVPGDRISSAAGQLVRGELAATTHVVGTFTYHDRDDDLALPRRQQLLVEQLGPDLFHRTLGDHVGAARPWSLTLEPTSVAEGFVYVLCDNRRVCDPARGYGVIALARISGVATSLVWRGDARADASTDVPGYGGFESLGAGPAPPSRK